jgi:hypothetical protein
MCVRARTIHMSLHQNISNEQSSKDGIKDNRVDVVRSVVETQDEKALKMIL